MMMHVELYKHGIALHDIKLSCKYCNVDGAVQLVHCRDYSVLQGFEVSSSKATLLDSS